MKIGVCDDEEVIRKTICNICLRVVSNYDEEIEIIQFSDGYDAYNSSQQPDILILDIEMPITDGIEVKERFQNSRNNTIIIFVTGHDEMMTKAFGINVIGFVTKNHIKTQLPTILEAAIKMVSKSVVVNGVDSRNIDYIKSEHIYSFFHMVNGKSHLVRKSSKELEKQLSSVNFIRVHRAYLVNLKYVDSIRDKNLVVNGTNIPISYRLNTEVKQKYQLYCKENARFC
ncbi:MAG: LytTR family DNA-binding domain-containing protein [Lachnospiraceae bacterium]|nr:LytTR family DNA-binding domain-containing protein [Lachnospiraceae bacterium]